MRNFINPVVTLPHKQNYHLNRHELPILFNIFDNFPQYNDKEEVFGLQVFFRDVFVLGDVDFFTFNDHLGCVFVVAHLEFYGVVFFEVCYFAFIIDNAEFVDKKVGKVAVFFSFCSVQNFVEILFFEDEVELFSFF